MPNFHTFVFFTANLFIRIGARNDICSFGSILGGFTVGSSLCNLSTVKRVCIVGVCRVFVRRNTESRVPIFPSFHSTG
jgi:hypothetical protein